MTVHTVLFCNDYYILVHTSTTLIPAATLTESYRTAKQTEDGQTRQSNSHLMPDCWLWLLQDRQLTCPLPNVLCLLRHLIIRKNPMRSLLDKEWRRK